jgi:hypothetical protein
MSVNQELIKNQVSNLIEDLQNYIDSSANLDEHEKGLQEKYKILFDTSKTLFNLIFNEYKKKNIDKVHFSGRNKEYFDNLINKLIMQITKN